MKRHIVVSVKGVELVNILLEEIDDEEVDPEQNISLSASTEVSTGSSVGFNTPWSAEYYDDEA